MKRLNLSLTTGALLALSGPVHAGFDGIFEVDITGWQTFGLSGMVEIQIHNWRTFGQFGTDANSRLDVDLSPYLGSSYLITGIGYDVQIQTVGASWLSDVALAITTATQQPNGNGVAVASTTSPGTGTFTSGGIIKFDEFQTTGGGFLSPVIDNDYTFALEVFDTYDDGGTAVQDAVLNGTVFIQVLGGFVPAPAPLALLGIAPIITPRRRRRS